MATPTKPKLDDLKKYLDLGAKRSKLTKKADALKREQALIQTSIRDWVKHSVGVDKLCKLSAKIFARIKTRQGPVKWKDEFIRVAGADAAAKIADKAKRTEIVEVLQE